MAIDNESPGIGDGSPTGPLEKTPQAALHSMLRSTMASMRMPMTPPGSARQGLPEAADQLARGLRRVSDISKRSTTPQNQQAKAAIMAELGNWLHSLPAEYGEQTVDNATPELVGIFLEEVWAPVHGRTETPEGGMAPAPSSLRNAISHLSVGFTKRGRRGTWDESAPQVSNPCNSDLIDDYKTGYRKIMSESGWAAAGAVPFKEGKVICLLQHLQQEACSTAESGVASTVQLLAARDGLAFSYAWSAASRSINSREHRLQNFTLMSDGSQIAPLIFPAWSLAAGTTVLITPDHLRKRGPDNNHEPVTVIIPDLADHDAALLCPVIWLAHILALNSMGGSPAISYLVRPLQHPRSTAFKDEPLAKASLQDRLNKVLDAISQHEGETLHSFRRGQAVAMLQAACSQEQIQDKLMLASTRHVNTYANPNRPSGLGKRKDIAASDLA